VAQAQQAETIGNRCTKLKEEVEKGGNMSNFYVEDLEKFDSYCGQNFGLLRTFQSCQ